MISICFAKNKYYNEEMEKFTQKWLNQRTIALPNRQSMTNTVCQTDQTTD